MDEDALDEVEEKEFVELPDVDLDDEEVGTVISDDVKEKVEDPYRETGRRGVPFR